MSDKISKKKGPKGRKINTNDIETKNKKTFEKMPYKIADFLLFFIPPKSENFNSLYILTWLKIRPLLRIRNTFKNAI